MAQTHTFSKGEEIANTITHGIGILTSIAALVLLIVFSAIHGTSLHVTTFIVYGVTMIMLYTASTLLHALPKGKAKNVFEILDHSSIYFFIAGSYTPITLIIMDGALGWTLFGIVWGLAIAGTVFKVFFVKRFILASTLLYVLMGWLAVFGWNDITSTVGTGGIAFLVAGGVVYSLGAVFYVWRAFPYHHAVWHVFVLGGTVLHFFFVLLYVLPIQ
ncbi:MAG: hemolysin III family protein [Bacillota bacterium]|jgi:hemolysin III|uniref:PAQR family membrane homeostasis protein TrhA n=1 Tax=Bacillus sp. RO2 TaxID=2723913 RepID=UPI00145D8305|nr:hemolysin III family protein [Bacillus sp. RO2]MEA3319259.1 hemolysin III family protein [Bacillota bacterium]NMH72444.1 hemolysin III family protein [Bacillus sp. RO2]